MAVVDTQRAIMETEDGLRAQATLKKLFDSRQRELDKKQEELQQRARGHRKAARRAQQGRSAKRVEKWQREMIQLQTVFVEYNKELQKKQSELTQPIFQKAMGIIRRHGDAGRLRRRGRQAGGALRAQRPRSDRPRDHAVQSRRRSGSTCGRSQGSGGRWSG